MTVTRRFLIKSMATATGGMLLGFRLPLLASATPYQTAGASASELNAWILIDSDSTITLRVAQSEMGQGIMTALPMILADELEVDWSLVKVEYADVSENLQRGGVYQSMTTAGSRAVDTGIDGTIGRSMPLLQQAGAEARMKLIKAAAETWSVDGDECYADFGKVYHRPTRRSLPYGELTAIAAEVSVANVKIKESRDFSLIGFSASRVDTPAKVDGSAIFGMDVRLEGMVYAAVKHCPILGGKLRGFRFNAVRNMPGVIAAVRLDTGVAIVADTFWHATQAVDKLAVQWDVGDENKAYTEKFRNEFYAALAEPGTIVRSDKDTEAALETAETILVSDYFVPYLAHACMEPMNCTVHVTDDQVDIWAGVQDPQSVVEVAAEFSGKPKAAIRVHNCYLGGGFGRRSNNDFVLEALTIAAEVRLPVQMIWSREEDMRSGQYRPMAAVRFKAGIDLDKNIVAYSNHSVAHSIRQDQDGTVVGAIDDISLKGLADLPYNLSPREISATIKNTHVPAWWWRSSSYSQNTFALECFIDEMAAATKMDPIGFRRKYLADRPDMIEVLNELERLSGWKSRSSKGFARGMAIHESAGSIVAQVAEVSVNSSGQAKVHRIVSVVDCGNLVNPQIAKSQIESGVVFGLSAVLFGKITIEQGKVLEDNFDTYRVMEMADTPVMETHFLSTMSDRWGGLGEPGVPAVAPAVVNALFKITGRRIRSLPVSDYYLSRR
ncbi:MAG: isoquinoline 1-oxidoreductase beta subunit [Candidatus Azotimanducaceae bacterium]|jgi:isoquinoline 1-oxidoreductase beta subunit